MAQRASADVIIEGKYRLERELGAGGMGSVWLATQLMVDRKVAVKLLHPAFIDQDDLQARFEVEAKAIGRLNHPNCITLFDFGYSDELAAFYTVIEYVEGQSLDKRLGQRMGIPEIVSICRQIALALDHAHHQGILHRDLKPENVMLARMTDGSEMVKVLDFGIARIVSGDAAEPADDSQRITKAGEVFGTPAYMSPEQARSIRELTPAADLYSLGVILYELTAGALPFFSKSAFDLLMLHVTKPVPPIEDMRVPEGLKEVIYRMMAKAPEERYQSGRAVAEALDALHLTPVGERSGSFETSGRYETPPRSGASARGSGELYARNASGEFVLVSDGSGEYLANAQDAGRAHPTPGSSQPTLVSSPEASGAYPRKTPVTIEPGGRRRGVVAALVIALLLGVAVALALFAGLGADEPGADDASAGGEATAEAAESGESSEEAPTLAATAGGRDDREVAEAEQAAGAREPSAEQDDGEGGQATDEEVDTEEEAVAGKADEPAEPAPAFEFGAEEVEEATQPAAVAENPPKAEAEEPPRPTRRKRPTRTKRPRRREETPAEVPKFNLESDEAPIPKLGL